MTKKVISLALDSEVDKEVGFIAKIEDVSKSVLYRKAINEYLERKRDERVLSSKRRLEEIERNYK